nr:hypothetical protein [uncultured Rhodopila sp.]
MMGADDGILSTASLVPGVAAARGTRESVLVAEIAGLVRWSRARTAAGR